MISKCMFLWHSWFHVYGNNLLAQQTIRFLHSPLQSPDDSRHACTTNFHESSRPFNSWITMLDDVVFLYKNQFSIEFTKKRDSPIECTEIQSHTNDSIEIFGDLNWDCVHENVFLGPISLCEVDCCYFDVTINISTECRRLRLLTLTHNSSTRNSFLKFPLRLLTSFKTQHCVDCYLPIWRLKI